jgi:mevalonate kinase
MDQQVVEATAPGKVILFGEHAVVYGRPAIAAPLSHIRARAAIEPGSISGLMLVAPDLGIRRVLSAADANDAFSVAVKLVQEAIELDHLPDMTITVTSDIPIAGGLGSGAAISAALVRALAGYLGRPEMATEAWVSALTYEVEKIHHGTPSGIDNTVVTYERPVYFVRRSPVNLIEPFAVARPLQLLIADTGIRSSTKRVVDDVRAGWKADPAGYEALFDGCGAVTGAARAAIEAGDLAQVGQLMNQNQALLEEMGVSGPELERLVGAARAAGALGAKLSGAGRGGNMVALVETETETAVREALLAAGAQAVLQTIIAPR